MSVDGSREGQFLRQHRGLEDEDVGTRIDGGLVQRAARRVAPQVVSALRLLRVGRIEDKGSRLSEAIGVGRLLG